MLPGGVEPPLTRHPTARASDLRAGLANVRMHLAGAWAPGLAGGVDHSMFFVTRPPFFTVGMWSF